jgi:hypothetical protein
MINFKKSVEQRRFYKKVMTGVTCRPKERLRVFVLTESNQAIDNGFEFKLKFKHLIAFLRKKYGKFEYSCVLHCQGDKKRLNYHVLFYGSYIPQQVIEDWWLANYNSHLSKMEEVRSPANQAKYLSKYLSKEVGSDEFVAAHFSSWWVFPGWWEFSKWIRHDWNEYPPDSMLRAFHKMTEDELKKEPWYALWRESKVNSGIKKPGREGSKRNMKVSLYEKVLRREEYEVLSIE